MKKLALLMGSLLIVAATASAKEVVAAPVVVEESKEVVVAPVVVIEEVKPAFRPNGSIGQELEYFGNTEKGGSGGDYLRFRPVQGNINLTEKVSADFRSRFRIGLNEKQDVLGKTDFRTRWYYNHGNVGDTQINATSRLRFEKTTKFASSYEVVDGLTETAAALGLNYMLEYSLMFNFANYFPSNDYFKVTKFQVSPAYSYMWSDVDGENYANTLGVDFYTSYGLPWGFAFDLNVYAFNTWANIERYAGVPGNYEIVDNYATIAVEALLTYGYKLAESEDGRANLMFLFEGGYDPYAFSTKKVYGLEAKKENNYVLSGKGEKHDYYLKAVPELRVNFKATDTTNVYVAVKGEYGNQVTLASKGSDWQWQPQALVGWNTKF